MWRRKFEVPSAHSSLLPATGPPPSLASTLCLSLASCGLGTGCSAARNTFPHRHRLPPPSEGTSSGSFPATCLQRTPQGLLHATPQPYLNDRALCSHPGSLTRLHPGTGACQSVLCPPPPWPVPSLEETSQYPPCSDHGGRGRWSSEGHCGPRPSLTLHCPPGLPSLQPWHLTCWHLPPTGLAHSGPQEGFGVLVDHEGGILLGRETTQITSRPFTKCPFFKPMEETGRPGPVAPTPGNGLCRLGPPCPYSPFKEGLKPVPKGNFQSHRNGKMGGGIY